MRKLYLQSLKPPCQVYKTEADPELPRTNVAVTTHLAVDIVRSRYSALYEATELPIFSVLNDPEEEHDCFSDNTHNSHYYDGLGIRNVYLGEYTRLDGTRMTGPSLADLVAAADAEVDARLRGELDQSVARLSEIKSAAEGGLAYDQMLAPGHAEGEALIMGAVDALVTQTASIERAVGALGLSGVAFEGSDSLDSPDKVFQ